MNHPEAAQFAATLPLRAADRKIVLDTLLRFPVACQSRGMFANGVLEAVIQIRGRAVAELIRENAGFPSHISSFRLYPHSDFYRLFYAAAIALHPSVLLVEAMRRVAEEFYPIFIQSLAGRTMHTLIGKTPRVVLGRFVEAYKIATPWCEHRIVSSSEKKLVWQCKVEPCANYEATFAGICTGMVRTVTGVSPELQTVSRDWGKDFQRFEFNISW